jgi:hypothetical protein
MSNFLEQRGAGLRDVLDAAGDLRPINRQFSWGGHDYP